MRYHAGRVVPRKGVVLGLFLLLLGGVAGVVVLGRALLRRGPPATLVARGVESPAESLVRWPGPAAALSASPAVFPPGFGVRRIYVDAGHGAASNRGNTSSFCVDEQDFTLGAARALAERLEATRHFEVKVSRNGDRPVDYKDRASEAAAWRAEVFMSLHSDVRGQATRWSPRPGESCPLSLEAPGFSVLWSDEGEAGLVSRRHGLARATAARMREAGFLPYDGVDYTGLYEADPAEPGVFVDRHAPEQRIFVLRRPLMPSILIETHHALDPREATRWTEPHTLDAFAAAVAAALVDALVAPAAGVRVPER